jgi:hypothetical protein
MSMEEINEVESDIVRILKRGAILIQRGGRMRVYIAGALSSKEKNGRDPSTVVVDYLSNVSKMCKAASEVRKMGHYPFVPGLDLLLGVVNGDWTEEMYRGCGMAFLEVCDAVLVISKSYGVMKEVERAEELGIPVYYSIQDFIRR